MPIRVINNTTTELIINNKKEGNTMDKLQLQDNCLTTRLNYLNAQEACYHALEDFRDCDNHYGRVAFAEYAYHNQPNSCIDYEPSYWDHDDNVTYPAECSKYNITEPNCNGNCTKCKPTYNCAPEDTIITQDIFDEDTQEPINCYYCKHYAAEFYAEENQYMPGCNLDIDQYPCNSFESLPF